MALRQLPDLVNCHDLHLLDSSSSTRRFVQCARQRARARVVETLEQSLEMVRRGRGAERKKLAKTTSKHLLQRVFSVNSHCVCVAHTYVCSRPETHGVFPAHTYACCLAHRCVCSRTHTHTGVSPSAARKRPFAQACRNDEICE